jgi:hypothetical protein
MILARDPQKYTIPRMPVNWPRSRLVRGSLSTQGQELSNTSSRHCPPS